MFIFSDKLAISVPDANEHKLKIFFKIIRRKFANR